METSVTPALGSALIIYLAQIDKLKVSYVWVAMFHSVLCMQSAFGLVVVRMTRASAQRHKVKVFGIQAKRTAFYAALPTLQIHVGEKGSHYIIRSVRMFSNTRLLHA